MSDAVHLGYQAALVSVHSPTYGRVWLSVEQHPGNAVSSSEAVAMVRAAEARTGTRPQRRTDLLRGRIEQLQLRVESAEQKREHARSRVAERQAAWEQVEQERQTWAQRVQVLEQGYQAKNRPERPYSQLAQARGLGAPRPRVHRDGPGRMVSFLQRAPDHRSEDQGRQERLPNASLEGAVPGRRSTTGQQASAAVRRRPRGRKSVRSLSRG